MDLSKPKPKKAHPETCNDQESDAAERCRVTETKAPADNDRDQHPRQDVQPKEKQDPPVTPNKSRSKTAATASSSPPARGGMSMPSQIMIMRMPPSVSLSSEDKELLRTADPLPPVTRETLSELDLDRIMRNIHLRTDANFETDLHFKPDLDGEKGLRKRAAADRYWSAVHIEIMAHAISTLNGESVELEVVPVSQLARIEGDWFQPRLPWMFETLQDILKTLVPERDHACVAQNLDVRLLMQQIRKGVLDLARLARWLAELLKMHCAPMRDQDADRMVTEISQGYDTHDMGKVVDGLRTLFGLLEMMKLVSCRGQPARKRRYDDVTDDGRTSQTIKFGHSASRWWKIRSRFSRTTFSGGWRRASSRRTTRGRGISAFPNRSRICHERRKTELSSHLRCCCEGCVNFCCSLTSQLVTRRLSNSTCIVCGSYV